MTSGKPASVRESSFNCPHCGTFTSQTWWQTWMKFLGANVTPDITEASSIPNLKALLSVDGEHQHRVIYEKMLRLAEGEVVDAQATSETLQFKLDNLWASKCFTCLKVSLWRHEALLYPSAASGEEANSDMPSDVRADFDEARTIINASPRGAAALLRLAIQKLCVHLGEPGKNINTDIGSLVAKGLPKRIEQALDAVRVIGNEAVHPGELDLQDDRDTVFGLLRVINVVVDNRISQPKHIDELYNMLPANKTADIEARNANAAKKLAQDPKG